MTSMIRRQVGWMAVVLLFAAAGSRTLAADTTDPTGSTAPVSTWKVGTPIVTYWAGPALTDAVAQQMADGGFNLVSCTSEAELDVARRHGLRGQFHNGLISPQSLDNAEQKKKLDALIDQVSKHPALYDYFITDEPSAGVFPDLGRLVAYCSSLSARRGRAWSPCSPAASRSPPAYRGLQLAVDQLLGDVGMKTTKYLPSDDTDS